MLNPHPLLSYGKLLPHNSSSIYFSFLWLLLFFITSFQCWLICKLLICSPFLEYKFHAGEICPAHLFTDLLYLCQVPISWANPSSINSCPNLGPQVKLFPLKDIGDTVDIKTKTIKTTMGC